MSILQLVRPSWAMMITNLKLFQCFHDHGPQHNVEWGLLVNNHVKTKSIEITYDSYELSCYYKTITFIC